jgi:hypothetical protein
VHVRTHSHPDQHTHTDAYYDLDADTDSQRANPDEYTDRVTHDDIHSNANRDTN